MLLLVLQQPCLHLYSIHLYRYLGHAEREDERDSQHRGSRFRQVDLGRDFEV
jgi:hypothetical protein